MSDPIVVADYDPQWPAQFAALAARVHQALGEDLVFSVEHVGSTSVPGLAAKPIIDLDVVIPSTTDLPDVIARLATIGYEHEGDKGVPGREAFLWPKGEPRHHLYVCTQDAEHLRVHLMFRDYLRAHPDEVQRYANLKHYLAERFRDDRLGYTEAKSEYVQSVLAKAQEKAPRPPILGE